MLEAYLNKVTCIDCLALMDALPPQSVDMIATDLCYGTTACSWDTIIPFEPMWAGVKRVLKPRGVFVTTASQPFTSALVMSNPKWFQEEWIWEKDRATRFLDANIRPLKSHENIIIFSEELPVYYPQMSEGHKPANPTNRSGGKREVYRMTIPDVAYESTTIRFPRSVVKINTVNSAHNQQHPTQKPVALYEYLIRTYTREGDTVLDFCCGSGTTGLAARNCGRQYILGDTDAGYCAIAEDRLRMPFEPKAVKADNNVNDLPLFAGLG